MINQATRLSAHLGPYVGRLPCSMPGKLWMRAVGGGGEGRDVSRDVGSTGRASIGRMGPCGLLISSSN